MTPLSCFSQSYAEARDKFLAAAARAGATLESHLYPERGPDGGPLFLDVALLGAPEAEHVLLLGSGTHGVEGFCGSGLQIALLEDGLADRLPAGVRVVLLHALNPYGFAHIRRVNEDNVDLNRNFVNHSQPYPVNHRYEALYDAINPVDYSDAGRAATTEKLLAYIDEHGMAAMQEAVSGGQYAHPQGLFYGGTKEAWSNRTIRSIAQEHLSGARRLLLVDFHTGLGEYGHGEVILNDPVDSPDYRRAVGIWGDAARSTKGGGSVSADLSGTLKLALTEMCPDTEVTGTSLEFGTVPGMEVFFAMQAENWLHHHGGPTHPQAASIKRTMRDAFYVDTDEWKHLVWDRARCIVDMALAGLAT